MPGGRLRCNASWWPSPLSKNALPVELIPLTLEKPVLQWSRRWVVSGPPSSNPATPPPHSTGAAVDLTLADQAGEPLDLGSPIDAIGSVSEPDYFRAVASSSSDPALCEQALVWQGRRDQLAAAMQAAGFAQHPNEWWHFSYGDQLWAWRTGQTRAIYGRSGC